MSELPSPEKQGPTRWQRVRRLSAWLLLAWFCLTFGVVFFARELDQIKVFGWPLSFYMAAQGAILLYLLIVGVYAICMRRLDRHPSRRSHAE
jgi:putative solute:sodium symporter small subunit